jgi:putative transposase
MQEGKTRWTHYSIAYHLVWIPKYRRKILTTEVEKATKELFTECCERHGLTLLALETDQDHVPRLVSQPRRAFHLLKWPICSKATVRARFCERFPHPEAASAAKTTVFTQAYYVGTAGSVSAEIIRRYIMECQGK